MNEIFYFHITKICESKMPRECSFSSLERAEFVIQSAGSLPRSSHNTRVDNIGDQLTSDNMYSDRGHVSNRWSAGILTRVGQPGLLNQEE